MKIQYLGTAAAEGIPGIFCDCETCKQSRKQGGRNIRTRSQAIIDGKLLVDFPPDTYFHSIQYGIELSKIHTCIITHKHSDHLYAPDIPMRKYGYAYIDDETPLTFYATRPGYEDIVGNLKHYQMEEENRIIAKKIQAFEPFEAEGYKITPLAALHDARTEPVIYAIEKEGKALLYGHDTGIFTEETWEYMEKVGLRFNLVSLDCTSAICPMNYDSHMNMERVQIVRDRMLASHLAHEHTIFVVNHFSHNGKATYDELVPVAKAAGFEVSYDGMIVEF